MDRYVGLPPLPDRINRLRELALDLWWSWNKSAREVFRRLDYPLWRATAHNPVRMLRMVPQATLEMAAANPDFLALYDKALDDLDAARSAARHVVGANVPGRGHRNRSRTSRPSSRCTSRCPSTPAALACWPAITARRRAISGVPLIGVGFMYPQGYFHQHVSAEGLAGRVLRKAELGRCADRARNHARRPALRRRRAARRSIGPRRGVARAARAREAISARYRPRGERALGSAALGPPLWRRSRDAGPAGNHSRHRRRPRPPSARIDAVGLPSERRARGLRGAAADPRVHRRRQVVRRGARGSPAHDDLHDAHAGARPGTTRSRSTWSRNIWPAAGDRWATCDRDFSRSANTTTAAGRSST